MNEDDVPPLLLEQQTKRLVAVCVLLCRNGVTSSFHRSNRSTADFVQERSMVGSLCNRRNARSKYTQPVVVGHTSISAHKKKKKKWSAHKLLRDDGVHFSTKKQRTSC